MKLQLGAYSNIYELIKEAALVLFRSQRFKNTSITDLVEYLKIEEGTLFFYFQSMDELLEAVWSES
jgi:AcrR family transcriptional regulator